MGWSSGSSTFSRIIEAVKPVVANKEDRKRIYRPIIEAFEDQDWDTQDECVGEDEAYDELYAELYPDDYA
ncbi:hypothetical protein EET67_04995 [Pseudaminobacter arsenicus]|uniref:Uncharacterized protein n=1 Tax=Borborobacter arsenicus TaxID=1851146 RepID=A0A432VA46_9HYPH|nr:hypothetical protein [Pseudaminobacter arsenicus]RUM99000.1 hypothetical protein EET67_04995 [Pseudaminobacter arsenicus]